MGFPARGPKAVLGFEMTSRYFPRAASADGLASFCCVTAVLLMSDAMATVATIKAYFFIRCPPRSQYIDHHASQRSIHHIEDVPGYPAPHSPYSHAVVANGFVFVSGQIPMRPGGTPTEVVGDTTALAVFYFRLAASGHHRGRQSRRTFDRRIETRLSIPSPVQSDRALDRLRHALTIT